MRVWLDDTRDAPAGWVRARWPEEAVALLRAGGMTALSLDHDLGPDRSGRDRTGYEVLAWLEAEVAGGRWDHPLPAIAVHSGNPVGRARMEQAVEAIRRLHGEGPA